MKQGWFRRASVTLALVFGAVFCGAIGVIAFTNMNTSGPGTSLWSTLTDGSLFPANIFSTIGNTTQPIHGCVGCTREEIQGGSLASVTADTAFPLSGYSAGVATSTPTTPATFIATTFATSGTLSNLVIRDSIADASACFYRVYTATSTYPNAVLTPTELSCNSVSGFAGCTNATSTVTVASGGLALILFDEQAACTGILSWSVSHSDAQ